MGLVAFPDHVLHLPDLLIAKDFSALALSTVSSASSVSGVSSSLWLWAVVGAGVGGPRPQFALCPCVADNAGQLSGPACCQHPGFTYSKVFAETQSRRILELTRQNLRSRWEPIFDRTLFQIPQAHHL